MAWGHIKKSPQSPAQSQTGSVSHFFGAKCETTPGLSSTGKPEEPSTSSSHDAGHTHKESEIMPTTQWNVLSKFLLTKHQHKAEILWALKTVKSHFSYNSATDITDVFRAMFPDSTIAQKNELWTHPSYLT